MRLYCAAVIQTQDSHMFLEAIIVVSGLAALILLVLIPVFLVSICGRIARRLARGRADVLLWERRAKIGGGAALAGLIAFTGYFSLYPGDGFYLAHFTEVTMRPPPASSTIVEKRASYPDHHGDFCSHSKIALSARDYAALLADIENDGRLTFVAQASESPLKHFSREKPGAPDYDLGITFLGDSVHIEIDLCVN